MDRYVLRHVGSRTRAEGELAAIGQLPQTRVLDSSSERMVLVASAQPLDQWSAAEWGRVGLHDWRAYRETTTELPDGRQRPKRR